MLKESAGNMYQFVTHTWNPIKGKCSHACQYCYMKGFKQNAPRLDKSEFKADLGKGNFIFIGTGTDMWAENIPAEWISTVIFHCAKFPANKYLFQSKNPARFLELATMLDLSRNILATTIETNRPDLNLSLAPDFEARSLALRDLAKIGFQTEVTIEPILDFDLPDLYRLVRQACPTYVNLGADSKGCKLPEPNAEKIGALIAEIEQFAKVHLKPNLKRLFPLAKYPRAA
jgi:DNA repair photolyase